MPTTAHPAPEGGSPGYGDAFPKLLVIAPEITAQSRLLDSLYLVGVAARAGGRDAADQKLFGVRIVSDPSSEWESLRPWVRAVVAFGADAWDVSLRTLALDPVEFSHGVSVAGTGDRPATVVAALGLEDDALTDAMLAEVLAAGQRAAGLSWGCGGSAG
ncbi:hypothetical protein [Rhodococcus kronopolitis]|uniref:Uncharacterized protein n=1 Tax=Rhodococcus kronopolitis TaxID=1460226 RepID=A0ABV9FVR0_9NOCA